MDDNLVFKKTKNCTSVLEYEKHNNLCLLKQQKNVDKTWHWRHGKR